MQNTITADTTENRLPDLFLRLLLFLSSGNDFSANMIKALQTLGEYSCHDRIHIVEIHHNMTYSIPYEWYIPSLQISPVSSQQRPLLYARSWEEQLCTLNYIRIEETDTPLSPESQALLTDYACHRMLLLPLYECGSTFAFLVFMQCQQTHLWENEEIRMLSDFSSLIASQLHHHRFVHSLRHSIKQHQKVRQQTELLHTRLKKLHAQILPTWQQVRNSVPKSEAPSEASSWAELDQHLLTFDKLCRTYL